MMSVLSAFKKVSDEKDDTLKAKSFEILACFNPDRIRFSSLSF